MVSFLHEALLQLFRNNPHLAPDLLREALHQGVPAHTIAQLEPAELNQLTPVQFQADLVVRLANNKPVLGIVVEIQLQSDLRKWFTWPAYLINLRSRLRCP